MVQVDLSKFPQRPSDRSQPAWIGLGEASRMLGVAPGTLRRWADAGRVPVFTTPGGHRRFPWETLRGLLPAARSRRPSLGRLGASPDRIARAYRGRGRSSAAPARQWAADLPGAARDGFRERGRGLVGGLLQHLDAPDAALQAAALQAAAQLAAAQGRESAALGVPLDQAVEQFLWFRAPFLDELAALARSRGLDTREATSLLADAGTAMDRLLVAMMTGHTLETGRRRAGA